MATDMQTLLTKIILLPGDTYEYNAELEDSLFSLFQASPSFSDLRSKFSSIASAAKAFGFEVHILENQFYFKSPGKFAIKVVSSREVIDTEITFIRDDEPADLAALTALKALPNGTKLRDLAKIVSWGSIKEYTLWNFLDQHFSADTAQVAEPGDKDFIYGFGEFVY